VVSSQAMPMTQYPYPSAGTTDTRIYRPQQPPSNSRYPNMDDSSAPLTQSYSTSNYPADTSSPQVSSPASFDTTEEPPAAVKARRPKKTKDKGGPALSEKEQEAMMTSGEFSVITVASATTSCIVARWELLLLLSP